MGQRGLIFSTWEAEWEPDWTAIYYRNLPRSKSAICGCVYCRIWNERRDRLLCADCLKHLQALGIDPAKDTGNSPTLLDEEIVYLAQYRVKGELGPGAALKQYACGACRTKVWAEQDKWERHTILINLSAAIPLDSELRNLLRTLHA